MAFINANIAQFIYLFIYLFIFELVFSFFGPIVAFINTTISPQFIIIIFLLDLWWHLKNATIDPYKTQDL